ncbi:18116_t:CDS:2 [Funneliformis geosporum]|uniref:18116_t:CDS:1 n=1 Tax=Funneliformis geosporum TaxID=1117311 RepID=A0A9W4T2K1_9GLOM|nr:18116_t:CDS:2 [Funneliformis geosporum]
MQPSPTMQIPKPYPTAKPSKDYTHNKNSKISPTNSNESETILGVTPQEINNQEQTQSFTEQ